MSGELKPTVLDTCDYDLSGDETTPSGAWTNGWVKIQEPSGSVLWEGVRRLLARREGVRDYLLDEFTPSGPLTLTVHHAWSGYSEYTITSTWDEITIEWGDAKIDYPSMAEFFRAVFEADLSYSNHETRWAMERDPEYGPIAKRLR